VSEAKRAVIDHRERRKRAGLAALLARRVRALFKLVERLAQQHTQIRGGAAFSSFVKTASTSACFAAAWKK
jgi:hypothetical protein